MNLVSTGKCSPDHPAPITSAGCCCTSSRSEVPARGPLATSPEVPSTSVHRIQEAQTTTYHVLWELVQQALADSDSPGP